MSEEKRAGWSARRKCFWLSIHRLWVKRKKLERGASEAFIMLGDEEVLRHAAIPQGVGKEHGSLHPRFGKPTAHHIKLVTDHLRGEPRQHARGVLAEAVLGMRPLCLDSAVRDQQRRSGCLHVSPRSNGSWACGMPNRARGGMETRTTHRAYPQPVGPGTCRAVEGWHGILVIRKQARHRGRGIARSREGRFCAIPVWCVRRIRGRGSRERLPLR